MAPTEAETETTAAGPRGKARSPHPRAPRAFVFGNAAFDEVFAVATLPVPGESVLGRARHRGLGGKGANQAIALARTGVTTCLVAAVGADWHGGAIRAALAQEPLEPVLAERPGLPSDRSIIFAQDDRDNVIVTTNECAESLTLADCEASLARLRPGDAVLLQGNLTFAATAALARACRDRGARLVLNPSPFDPALGDLLALTDILFVNETEARGLTGLSREEAVAALRRAGARQVVLTLGAEGALLGSQGPPVHVPAVPTAVVDVTGAGDCFEGVAVGSALLRRTDLDETALCHASRAAAHTITGLGAAPAFPTAGQIAAMRIGARPGGGGRPPGRALRASLSCPSPALRPKKSVSATIKEIRYLTPWASSPTLRPPIAHPSRSLRPPLGTGFEPPAGRPASARLTPNAGNAARRRP